MALATEALLIGLLKRRYDDTITPTIEMGIRLLGMFTKKKPRPFGDGGLYFAVEVNMGSGFGARDGGAAPLPRSYAPEHKQSLFDKRRIYATCVWDEMIEDNVKAGPSAFADGVKTAINGVIDQSKWHMNRMCHMDGLGRLGLVDGAQNSATILLSSIWGYNYGATQYAQPGSLVVFGTIVGGVLMNPRPRRITTRSWSAQTIGLDQAVEVFDGDVMVLGDDQGHSYNKEWQGIEGMIGNSGTFQNIDSSLYPRWQSYVRAVDADYNWNDVLDLIMAVEPDDIGGKASKKANIMWHKVMARQHQRANENSVLFKAGEEDFPRGSKTPTIQYGTTVYRALETKWQPFETIYSWQDGAFVTCPIREWKLDTRGGAIKPLHGTDASFSKWKAYGNNACYSRKVTGKLTGVRIDKPLLEAIMGRS